MERRVSDMSRTFRRGVAFPHDVEKKELTAGLPPEVFHPSRVVIPLKQGFGEACLPVVEPGQIVKAGQMVGRPADALAVSVHCGISGKVTALEPRPTLAGECLCVEVENDFTGAAAPPLSHAEDRAGLIALMREAGIVGMGGAGFPAFKKYETDKPIRQVLVNGCECEPYLTCDDVLMTHYPDRVVQGAAALGRAAGDAEVLVCIEDNKPDAVAALRAAVKGSGVQVLPLPDRYPQGGERQLIQAVTGREVPAGGLPADCGVIVSNVATAAAMADALKGKPLAHRLITVSGRVARPANVLAPVGTLFSDLLGFCGGEAAASSPLRVIAGGPMTGLNMDRLDVPITKVSGGLVLLPPPPLTEYNCIHCGACSRVCPSRLIPFAIDASVIAGDMAACADYHAEQCISCGCCTYVCPAKRFLATRASLARTGVLRRRRAAN